MATPSGAGHNMAGRRAAPVTFSTSPSRHKPQPVTLVRPRAEFSGNATEIAEITIPIAMFGIHITIFANLKKFRRKCGGNRGYHASNRDLRDPDCDVRESKDLGANIISNLGARKHNPLVCGVPHGFVFWWVYPS